jgi:two-component system, chemotaxis family, protein-glutamate methylesterase/glutaminase
LPGRDIIVIGASAGGVEALQKLVKGIPKDIPAAIFIVLHIPAHNPSYLPEILTRVGNIKAKSPKDREPIEPGQIYVAPPDHHMLIERDFIRIVHGPKENRHRPAVDPLFRSAARAYNRRVIGVILTGALDDGTAGLNSIKRLDGITVVQDPLEALYPSMPQSAMASVQIDYVLPIAAIATLLERLAHETVEEIKPVEVAEPMGSEINIVENGTALSGDNHPGAPSAYSCPECGGVLWEIKDGDLTRFRCRVGHAFSIESMMAEQSDAIETALWAALKTLEESASLSERLALAAHGRDQTWLAERYEQKASDARENAIVIQNLLMKTEQNLIGWKGTETDGTSVQSDDEKMSAS